MMRFFVKALLVFAVIGALGLAQVDRVHQRRIVAGEPMSFGKSVKHAALWSEKEG